MAYACIRNFLKSSLELKKNKDVEIENYGQKATLLEEMPQGKPKETMREEVMPTLKKTKIGRKVIKPDLYIDQICCVLLRFIEIPNSSVAHKFVTCFGTEIYITSFLYVKYD